MDSFGSIIKNPGNQHSFIGCNSNSPKEIVHFGVDFGGIHKSHRVTLALLVIISP